MVTHTDIILDSVADGVFTIDMDWHITSFNAAAERITGIAREEAIGRPARELIATTSALANPSHVLRLVPGLRLNDTSGAWATRDGGGGGFGVTVGMLAQRAPMSRARFAKPPRRRLKTESLGAERTARLRPR